MAARRWPPDLAPLNVVAAMAAEGGLTCALTRLRSRRNGDPVFNRRSGDRLATKTRVNGPGRPDDSYQRPSAKEDRETIIRRSAAGGAPRAGGGARAGGAGVRQPAVPLGAGDDAAHDGLGDVAQLLDLLRAERIDDQVADGGHVTGGGGL